MLSQKKIGFFFCNLTEKMPRKKVYSLLEEIDTEEQWLKLGEREVHSFKVITYIVHGSKNKKIVYYSSSL